MRRFLLTLDMIIILFLVYSNFSKEKIFKDHKHTFRFNFYFSGNLNKLSIKYQSDPKSTKMNAFEQNICRLQKII